MSAQVVVIDNGGANTASILYALERLGARALLTVDPGVITDAPHVILPGVGSAAEAMRRLKASRLSSLIRGLRQPLLGICLGMQLLYEGSSEGDVRCLGLIAGRAERLLAAPGQTVPHMGWNTFLSRKSPLLEGIDQGARVYFAHSYALPISTDTTAVCHYGEPFCAAVSRENFHGVQFHPERSGPVGARILTNFLALGG